MKVGIQLYSVRQNMEKDPLGTIRKVVEAGYKNLEVANHNAEKDAGVGFGVSADEINKLLKETGASIVSAHIFPLIPEKMDPVLEYHKAIGTKYIAMPMDFFKDKDEVLRKCEAWNKVGEKCKSYGIQMVYHNHYHEFQHFGGETVFDMLLTNLDKDLIKYEIDTYWTMRAGMDPVEWLKKLGNRVVLIHQKDFTPGFEDQMNLLTSVEANSEYVDMDRFGKELDTKSFTEIGTGIMDIQSIIDTGNTACDVDYIILEQDYSQMDEFDSIARSMGAFKKFNGIEW